MRTGCSVSRSSCSGPSKSASESCEKKSRKLGKRTADDKSLTRQSRNQTGIDYDA